MDTGCSRRRCDTVRYRDGPRESFIRCPGESTVQAKTLTAERLHALAELYQQGQVSAQMERTLEKLLRQEAEECRAQLRQLQADLASFEQKYHRSSTEFHQQFQAGQTSDEMDYVEWASLVQMAANLEKRLRLLTGEADA
jgi:anti-sigma-K factor RskA